MHILKIHAYMMKGNIILEGDNHGNKRNKNLAFENNAPFINCISKINGVKLVKLRRCNAYVQFTRIQ